MSCSSCNQNWATRKIEQAKHLGQEIVDTVRGNSYTINKADQMARLEHCRVCPKLNRRLHLFDSSADVGMFDKCDACGCESVKAKASRSEQECPEGKWGKVD